jgi:hypothetical protein
MNRPSVRSRLAATSVGALLAAAGLAAAPASADDPTPLVSCTGTYASTYTPGLTSTPKPTTFAAHGTLGPCVSGLGPDFASAEIETGGSGDLSCVAGGNTSGTGTLTWAGGQESEFSHTGLVSLRPLGITVLVIDGTITDGALDGATFVWTVTFVTLDLLNCLTPQGVTSMSGPTTLTVTPL